ncbi:MAG: SDR family oxidoreductase [Lentisphaerae bacterium]|nr:SDR family oxidoreductase [Lentisphaerota bacterium]MCP4100248.1 SDR family oxidoreductase [Lentisphaerota bacterium]
MKKTVLITGCSSGFGKLAAKTFHAKGWNVIATMRSPEKETELVEYDNTLISRLDVTDKSTIRTAVSEGIQQFGRIDVLVNNAGYGAFGFLEEASESEVEKEFDTNLVGVVNTIQEVVSIMRKQRKGCIINITSIGGTISAPFLSLYNATKFAVEGLSQSLYYELKHFGIDVKTVAPGGFKTNFFKATTFNEGNKKDDLNWHRNLFKSWLKKLEKGPPKPFQYGDPQEVTDKIYYCATNKTKVRNFVGKDVKTFNIIKALLPNRIIIKMFEKNLQPNFKKAF